jgi:GMP synthase (glutamine-hydrolysing)
VGVQGDSRSYAPVICVDSFEHSHATELINRLTGVNRVVTLLKSRVPVGEMQVRACSLTPQRLARLRRADDIVRQISHASGYDHSIWQFPVILIPLGTAQSGESVVLRPVQSVDGMTAQSAPLDGSLVERMCSELLKMPEVCGIFYDLTHKPPGTIEWE